MRSAEDPPQEPSVRREVAGRRSTPTIAELVAGVNGDSIPLARGELRQWLTDTGAATISDDDRVTVSNRARGLIDALRLAPTGERARLNATRIA